MRKWYRKSRRLLNFFNNLRDFQGGFPVSFSHFQSLLANNANGNKLILNNIFFYNLAGSKFEIKVFFRVFVGISVFGQYRLFNVLRRWSIILKHFSWLNALHFKKLHIFDLSIYFLKNKNVIVTKSKFSRDGNRN